MSEPSRGVRKKLPAEVPVYTRLPREDVEMLRQKEAETGAPVAAQIRIIVHEALRRQKGIAR